MMYRFAERRHVNGYTAVVEGDDYEGDVIAGLAVDAKGERFELRGGVFGDEADFKARLIQAKRAADQIVASIPPGHSTCACVGWTDFNPPKDGA